MKRILALLLCLALAACSATKLVYNRLDWLTSWQVGKFVELEGASEQLFNSRLESLWQWHRGTQLPLYAGDLRELAEAAGAPLSPAQVESFMQRANAHGERVLDRGLPGAAQVFATLDDRQVSQLLERVAERREERIEKDAQLDAEERVEESVERMEKQLKQWLGSVTPAQEARVTAWVAARRFEPALWQRYSEQWAAAFGDILAARTQPDFGERLRGLLMNPQLPASAQVYELQVESQRASVELMSEFSGMLSAAQREHLQAELRSLAQDLEILAAESAKKT